MQSTEDTQIKRIATITRARSSYYGNPAFNITFEDGDSARTMANAGFAYAIGNKDMREGSLVAVEFTARGTIRNMGPEVMTAEELKETEAAYKVASEQAEKLRAQRNKLVRRALAEGWTHAQIGEAAGLSRGRIGQIAQTGEKK